MILVKSKRSLFLIIFLVLMLGFFLNSSVIASEKPIIVRYSHLLSPTTL